MGKTLGRKEKWEAYASEIDTNTSSKIATRKLTVANTIALLNGVKEGKLLDIGCGFGGIDVLLAQRTNFQITGCDISARCIANAKENVRAAGLAGRVNIEEGDVYNLHYPDNYFDVVVSFGYASAASYEGAQAEVARVLKPNGLLVCDFINPFCVYKVVHLPKRWAKIVHNDYNALFPGNIKNHFRKYNLHAISELLFNTYPPFDFIPASYLIFFEKTLGNVFHRILGRVRLVCFQKI